MVFLTSIFSVTFDFFVTIVMLVGDDRPALEVPHPIWGLDPHFGVTPEVENV